VEGEGGGGGRFWTSSSKIAGQVAREVFDTSKGVFLNKSFVFESFRRKFQNPEKVGAKTCFLIDLAAVVDLQLDVQVHQHLHVPQRKKI